MSARDESANPAESSRNDRAADAAPVVDATHCELARSAFVGEKNYLLSDPRIERVTREGKVIGFRNASIGARSVYERCGMRSADIWTAINGHSMANPEEALAAYESLSQSERLDIELLRKNQPIIVHVTLTKD